MPYKYVGRINYFKGKTLWEIVANLRDFGVGRIVTRSIFERYPEPSYMKIVKVETVPHEDPRKVRVWVEKTFRGRKSPNLVQLYATSYKNDYRLIPKAEVEQYCHFDGSVLPERVLPRSVEFPPLLKELIIRDKLAAGEKITEDPKLMLKYRMGRENRTRFAEEGEKPTVEIVCGLGTPISPELYKGINL